MTDFTDSGTSGHLDSRTPGGPPSLEAFLVRTLGLEGQTVPDWKAPLPEGFTALYEAHRVEVEAWHEARKRTDGGTITSTGMVSKNLLDMVSLAR